MAHDHDDSNYEDEINENQHLLSSNRPNNNDKSRNIGISWYFAVFLIVNAALGAGLLNFAKAFDNAGGILYSSLIQIFLVIIIVGALLILAYCTDSNQSSNFQDVIYSMCGKKWQTINSLCIILYMFGCCITFFIIIGDQLDQIITCIFGAAQLEHWYFHRKFTIAVTSILFILPLCYPKRIDFLTYPSTFAVIAIIYVVILIPIKYSTSKIQNVVVKQKPDHWTDVFTVIPVICFGYQCHVNAVPIYACLKNKSLKEFSKSIIVSIIIVFAAYTISATFGYLTFGVNVNDDLLKSYDARDASVLVAIIMYLIKTYTSYPLNLFCARTAIEGLWIELFKLDSEKIIADERKRRIVIVTLWFLLSLLIALFIPNISIVIRYLGALAGTFMFIFPGLCLLFLALNKNSNLAYEGNLIESINNDSINNVKSKLLIVIAVFYIAIGVFIMGLVVTQSLITDLKL